MPPATSVRVFRFGTFELDVRSGELRKRGVKVRLPPQSLQVLVLLLERSGDVVTREELRDALWPADTFVDFDMGVASAVKKLREALGDSAENPRFVETLPRRGYRLLGGVAATTPTSVPPSELVRPGRRWAWTAPVIASLLAAAVLGLDVAGVRSWLAVRTTTRAAVPIRSLAVLPLANLSGDRTQDYFAAGMTDALITELAQVRNLRVISRTSVMAYQGMAKPAPQIARELGVDAVVEGTVVRVGERVRVTAQLIHGPTDRHLWARSYERELTDVLSLQGEIAVAIAQAVEGEVRPGPRRASATVDPEAYEACLKGRFYWSARQTDGLFRAADQFQKAIDRDPRYAPAWSGLSDTYRLFDMHGLMRPVDSMPKAEEAARRALALDDGLGEAHASLAAILFRYRWDWAGAEREYRRTLELTPSYAEGHRSYAVYLMAVHRPEQAVAEMERARALSPLSPIINTELGVALWSAGRVEEAVVQLEKTRAADPGFTRASLSLALVYGARDPARTLAIVEETPALAARNQRSPWVGYLYGVAGRRHDALDVLAELETRERAEYVSPQSFAVVHLGLGDRRQALRYLDKACDERAIEWLGFATEVTARLGGDARFQSVERRLGLPVALPAAASSGR